MLPHPHRIPSLLIRKILRNGTRVSLGSLQLCYKLSEEICRFGVLVPKRIDKRATARNRQRRLIAESLRLLEPCIKPVDGVFLLTRPLPVDSIAQVKPLIEALLKKAGLL